MLAEGGGRGWRVCRDQIISTLWTFSRPRVLGNRNEILHLASFRKKLLAGRGCSGWNLAGRECWERGFCMHVLDINHISRVISPTRSDPPPSKGGGNFLVININLTNTVDGGQFLDHGLVLFNSQATLECLP